MCSACCLCICLNQITLAKMSAVRLCEQDPQCGLGGARVDQVVERLVACQSNMKRWMPRGRLTVNVLRMHVGTQLEQHRHAGVPRRSNGEVQRAASEYCDGAKHSKLTNVCFSAFTTFTSMPLDLSSLRTMCFVL